MGRVLAIALAAGCDGASGSVVDAGASAFAHAHAGTEEARVARRALRALDGDRPGAADPRAFVVPSSFVKTTDGSERFVLRRRESSAFFDDEGFALSLAVDGGRFGVRARLVGARRQGPVAERPLRGVVNDHVGDSSRWRAGAPTFGQLAWEEAYPGIDLVVEPARGGFAYRFVLSPGADPRAIALQWTGPREVRVANEGRDLEVDTGRGLLRVTGLRAFAVDAGQRRELGIRHVARDGHVGFELDGWSGDVPVVIDPAVSWSSYLGGGGDEGTVAMTIDAAGNVLLAGSTKSGDFPATAGLDTSFGGGERDAFVTKVTASGAHVWSTYLGGAGDDGANGIAVDGSGNVFVTGGTDSADFPATGGFDTTLNLMDGFVTKLGSAGTIAWSSYLGGSAPDYASSVAVDTGGNLFVVGATTSADFPSSGGFDTSLGGSGGAYDAFITKISGAGAIAWSSYLGGSSHDFARGVAIDPSGDALVVGMVQSADFPTTGGFQTTYGGLSDAFVTKVSSGGTLAWSSYLGGNDIENGASVAIDASGAVLLVGQTRSGNFPSTGGFDTIWGGGSCGPQRCDDAFVTKVSGAGTLVWSSYLGGTGGDGATRVTTDGSGNVLVAGYAQSSDFPSKGGFDTTLGGASDAFLTKVASGGTLVWSSYLGGAGYDGANAIAFHPGGTLYVAGTTQSADFPTAGAFDATLGGPSDAFVAKLPQLPLSGACTEDFNCLSGSCADGVCCDKACTAPCEACSAVRKGSGSDGTCGFAAAGTDPRKLCAPATCADASTSTNAQVCDGAGACKANGTTACGRYVCKAGVCPATCAADGDCATANYCLATVCVAKRAAGASCSEARECLSGSCVDGVCCDKPCTSKCEACSAAKKGSGVDGACGPVTAGTDPDGECAIDPGYPGSCKADGMCDGKGACRTFASAGTPCGSGSTSCTGGSVTGSTCNGSGLCNTATVPCAPFACGATACKATCSADTDCASDAYCTTTGACLSKFRNGDKCAAGRECTSGRCVDGVCCDVACTGSCEACDLPGSEGLCAKVKGAPRGGRAPCAGAGTPCAGTCDGAAATCAFPDAKTACGAGCADAKLASCDGKGACSSPEACPGNYACASPSACAATCAGDPGCAPGYGCAAGSCVPKTAKCSDDRSQAIATDGTASACGAYLCDPPSGTCPKQCTQTTDCAAGFACDGAKCVALASEADDDAGCGCGVPGRARSSEAAWLAVAAAIVAIARRRHKHDEASLVRERPRS
ncbi:MAG: SBBP repeat-containing protein [Deltaproteobacteria bacterium]|nr:SBBP repeat-containing protein [Deltaproteobacteria bacterium]